MTEYQYFFIFFPRNQEEKEGDIHFTEPTKKNEKPEVYYSEYENKNKKYYYKKILKIQKPSKSNYKCAFELKDDKYEISFDSKGKTFIYDVTLEYGLKIITVRKGIKQNKIEYKDKMDFFIKALKEKEKDKEDQAKIIDVLLSDTINLYSKKKGFNLLIPLFTQVYKKDNLCKNLMKIFKETDEKSKAINLDRNNDLYDYKSFFNIILTEADNLIKDNKYNTVEFYGIIFSYLNKYDKENFIKVLIDLSKTHQEDVYEIMIAYRSHLTNLINLDFAFFNKFIGHIIENKDFNDFKIGLSYIKDLETFINIIEKNKEEIYEKYGEIINENNMIKTDQNLKLKYNENNDENKNSDYIKNIKSILEFSNEKKIFIYFTNDFWKYIINCHKVSNPTNIEIVYDLRKVFKSYKDLIEKFIKEDSRTNIRKDVNECSKNDEFAFLLDQMIKIYIDKNKTSLDTIEKLSLLTERNPYYEINEYPKRVDPNIFNILDLNEVQDNFVKEFRKMNFELIFKFKLTEYIKTIISKVKNISNLDAAIKLINIKNLNDFGDKNLSTFLEFIAKKYDIIKKEIENYLETSTCKKLEEAVKVTDPKILKNAKLDKAIEVIINLTFMNYKYEKEKGKFIFINNIIKSLPKNIIPLIYIGIINKCIKGEEIKAGEVEDIDDDEEEEDLDYTKDIDLEKIRKYIFGITVAEIKDDNDINNMIIKIIECIKGTLNQKKDNDNNNNEQNEKSEEENTRKKILNEFLNDLIDKNLFTKEEFFNNKNNVKISLLCKLNEEKLIEESQQKYYKEIKNLIQNIYNVISNDNIKKKKLEEFLKNNDAEKRLGLMNIIYSNYKPDSVLKELNEKIKKINENIDILKTTKENIILYYKESQKDLIKELLTIIKKNENLNINENNENGNLYELIKKCNNLTEKVEKIKKVKDFLLFNIIYEMNSGINEEQNFKIAQEELDNIGKLIKEKNIESLYKKKSDIIKKTISKLRKNQKENEKFIDKLVDYYGLTKPLDEQLIDDLTILFRSEKYKFDINSMIFFFECLNKENEKWDNNEWIKKLYEYKDLSAEKFKETKEKLSELSSNEIYNYKNIDKNIDNKSNNDLGEYNKLFRCLYDKKEAIDFLIDKTENISQYINDLKNKIDPTNTTIKMENILDTKICIECIKEMKKRKDYKNILNYIKNLHIDKINSFVNYSKNYSQIIELDRYYNPKENIYEEVEHIIKNDLTLNILQDTENFFYILNGKRENIKMEDLIKLKNKIPPKTENDEDNKNKTKEDSKVEKDDSLKSKSKILIFFKNLVTNLEKINEYMEVLRTKGSSLPININIKVKLQKDKNYNKEYYSIDYYLEGKENSLNDIENKFLSPAKNAYISLLNSFYEKNQNIRLLYGKQFRSMMKHLEDGLNIDSFLRYIINNIDSNNQIKEGERGIVRAVTDYINHYDEYNEGSLKSISDYIDSLFEKNEKKIEYYYDDMKIESESLYKGIYLHKCKKNNSMEEFIINLYWDKTNKLPIAQNVLITNKETSDEEMQSFFYRSILCNYHILFIVEINDSISEYQQSIMNSYISQLLSKKLKKYKENKGNDSVKKKNTSKYLDSCIVFIYEEENTKIKSFLKEISKLENQNFENELSINEIKNKQGNYKSEIENIKVITSDICGLGKSEQIRKEIKEKEKTYYHFPLGGILTKNIIFDKLKNLLDKIKNESYKDIAVHLDLTESEEKSIINEFFFSFLITKFYTNNENILYIPKDMYIYIEIPNCFDDYLEKFSILNIFNKENITFEKMPRFNYEEKIRKIFQRMLEIDSNEKIKEFIKEYIGIKGKYSYHQINIFIKLFISQYSKFDTKLYFYEKKIDDNGNEVRIDTTKQCIQEFAKCTQYFTYGGFAKLLTGETKINKNDYIDKLSEIYENDLENMDFPSPLVFIIKEEMKYEELMIQKNDLKKYKKSNDYLKRLKQILYLPNEVDKDNYVITNDNFKKMVLLVYRIKANVPVIIMGETGCGKTALITKLNQILNNGETTVIIKNIHPGITDEKLCIMMKEVDKMARHQGENKELWLFFDEINTCPSLSLITEIFINRTYYGNTLSDNIRLIGACNPYRKRRGGKEKCGLSFPDDNDNELVYLVNPLPQSLLYYVFSFGRINDDDEKKYIKSIIEVLFPKSEKQKLRNTKSEKEKDLENKNKIKISKIYLDMNEREKAKFDEELEKLEIEIKIISRELKYHDITTEAISQCHKYLRKTFDESVVSLREISRFPILVEFFKDYFNKKNNFLKRANNEKNNKIRSIICSIYLCYYIRLTEEFKRNNFEQELRDILLQLVTYKEIKPGKLKEQIQIEELKMEIESRPEETIGQSFSDFLKIEQNFLMEQINPDEGIGKNTLLKENSFLLFVSILTNIPLIIIGKPGTGKSLSVQLLNKSLKGEYSNKNYFKLYQKIIQTYFQGSLSTNTADVENLFIKLGAKLEFYKELQKNNPGMILPISMGCFDELGLAERSKNNPLKALHAELDYAGKKDKKNESFVGISNYSLDAAKLNRTLVLSVPDLDQKKDELMYTAKQIVESIAPKIKDDKIFEILSNTYYEYKKQLQFIKELVVYKKYHKIYEKGDIKNKEPEIQTNIEEKELSNKSPTINSKDQTKQEPKIEFSNIKKRKKFKDLLKKDNKIRKDFHGNRDFYNLIKGIANALRSSGDLDNNEKVNIITKYIERNFGGIEYKVDINFNLIPNDISEEIERLKNILEEYDSSVKTQPIRLNSVYLFKKLYNIQCNKNGKDQKDDNLLIDKNDIKKYNLNSCINDNISDTNSNSRYLLLEINQSLTPLIFQNIKLENEYRKKIKLYDGSPFPDDDNNEYKFKKISEIRDDAKDDKLIIIENLDQIHPFLFDFYNMNYEIIDEEKYAKICLDSFRELKTLVNERFRIIILADERFVDKYNLAFLNRLEKMNLSFDKLLDDDLEKKSENIVNGISLNEAIKNFKKSVEDVNYSLEDLLINCGDQEIRGLIYYYSTVYKKSENDDNEKKENIDESELKKKVIDKIYKILPQDIISILGKNDDIKKKYYEDKNISNFKGYLNYLETMKKDENKEYKISIIYTFTSNANIVEGLDREMSFMISRIRSEKQFKSLIDDIKKKNENPQKKYIYIYFEQSDTKNTKFICNFILNNLMDDDYKYIIIIQINRNYNKIKDINKNNNKGKDTNKNNNKDKIYSLPDINPNIDQIFIDNLNGNDNIGLKDLLDQNENDMKNIIDKLQKEQKLDEEFNGALTNFLREELDKKGFQDKEKKRYISEILNYMDNEEDIKNKIIEVAYKLNNESEDEENNSDIIENIHKKKLINQFTVDIVSILIDYMKEEMFIKNLKYVFKILEDNNILTTLIEIQKRNYDLINQNIIKEIMIQYLDEMVADKNYNYNCKFLYNYNIPGLYNFFIYLSNYINKNISSGYFNNEKIIRGLLTKDDKKLEAFHKNEESFLDIVYKEISSKNNFIISTMEKMEDDIFFKEYLTFYLEKNSISDNNIYKIDDIYHKIIILLLQLRFNNENDDIKRENNIHLQIKKIIWIESNINYILNILKIIDRALIIFNNDEKKLFEEIEKLNKKVSLEESIEDTKEYSIKYITNEKKNPEVTKEVNQCYYILLAIICYCITSDRIKEEKLDQYYNNLKIINKILQKLNDELLIYLNEMYIIDELIKVIEIFRKTNDIEKINEIKDYLRENADIIQKYTFSKENISEKLTENFEKIYKSINGYEKIDKEERDKYFYDNLRYILYKELKKINEIDYREKILEKLLSHNIMIKKSNDIFQIVLKNYLNKNNFKENQKYLTNESNNFDNIIILIENHLNNVVLAETLLYLFEKNSLNYFNNILKNEKSDGVPLEILKDCIKYLNNYINKPTEIKLKIKEYWKLFSIGYIKTFCYIMFKNNESKIGKPELIIEELKKDNSVYLMIRLYIYKILHNNYNIDYLKDEKNTNIKQLRKLKEFEEFIKMKELTSNIYKIDYKIKTLKDEGYESIKKDFENFESNNFKSKIKARDYNMNGNGIDNFYVVSYNTILSNLLSKKTEIQQKFYDNICKPLFISRSDDILFKAIQLFYDPKEFEKILTQYKINSNSMKPLLYGYRYCLNELSIKKNTGLYYSLYDETKLKNIKDRYYPGNDTKLSSVFYEIFNHFKYKPNEGCFVCLCDNLYYHSIPSGFPGLNEVGKICPKCKKNIGSIKKGEDIIMVNRKNYYRIFKDEEEMKKINKSKLKEINCMTLKDLNKYMTNIFKSEKGIYISDKISFKNENKIIRNLNQISFRLLNFILYSHLFFARLTKNSNEYDKLLSKGIIWEERLTECWNSLEKELKKVNIYSIDKFMNYIFVNLFPILNNVENIDNYTKLIDFEDKLKTEIQSCITNFEQYYLNLEKEGDKNSLINLINEKYSNENYQKDYPFYNFFYYTSYLDEEYINKNLDGNKYTVLKMYLENKVKPDKYKYLVDNICIFNNTLNLMSHKYFNNISKDRAEEITLKESDIYKENIIIQEKLKSKDLFDKFINFYKKLKLDGIRKKEDLKNENHLCDFFIREDNEFGKNYKKIYEIFIKQQNEKIKNLLEKKGIYEINTENIVKVQQINEDDVFNLNLPKKTSFIDILFNSSYRKILDREPINYKLYKEYEIDFDLIENIMEDLLLNNKKLLNETITEFIYNNESFNNEITNIFTIFKKNYTCSNIIPDDKIEIYKFCNDNETIHKEMIKDFITLIKYLNEIKKENNIEMTINKEEKIYVVIDKLKDKIKYLNNLFENNNSLTIDKTLDIFEYYLKVIYKNVSSELKEYQEDLDDNLKEKLNKFYSKSHFINKKDLAQAIRIFITLVLFREDDKEKENKIQKNNNNIMNYLRAQDLWNYNIDNNEKFTKDFDVLKSMNIKIKQIIYLYEFLGKDIDDNFFDDVEKKEEEEEQGENNESEKNDDSDEKSNNNNGEDNNEENENNDEVDPDDRD